MVNKLATTGFAVAGVLGMQSCFHFGMLSWCHFGMLSWCQATFSEADVLALQIIAARMSTSLMRVRAVLAQMWHGCAGTDRRMSRLHWRPPRAAQRRARCKRSGKSGREVR